jgi:rhomboid protease GluP
MEPSSNQTEEESVVFNSVSNTDIDTCSLVLSAKNIGHRISRHQDGTTTILVPARSQEAAAYQLDCFFRENVDWPPKDRSSPPSVLSTTPPTLWLIGALALFYMVTGPWNYSSAWFSSGAGDATAVLADGQYYRLVTALTLHADFSHLLGNCLIGGILLHFFLQINGTGLGLLALLSSAALGNYANVLAHGGNHLSVGFSTAVFAIVGMLSVHQILEQRQPFGIRVFVPLMAGAALLAMLGSSGVRTDFGGHLFGLFSGIACGFILGQKRIRLAGRSSFIQTCCFLISVSVLLTCWNMALNSPAG